MTGVEEIFDVQVLPGARCPALSGPYPSLDGAAPIWTVPQPPPASGDRETLSRRRDRRHLDRTSIVRIRPP